MPTGYTTGLYDGDQTLEQFAFSCAPAFLHFTRDSEYAEVPDEYPANNYYAVELEKAKAKLAAIKSMADADATAQATAEYYSWKREKLAYQQKESERRARYQGMIEQINAWNPAPEILDLKKFMLKQIAVDGSAEESDFDAFEPYEPSIDALEWRDSQIEKVEGDVNYLTRQNEAELARAREYNTWLQAFRAEFPEAVST